MTQTTTIKAGEAAKTIQIPEGESLTISGSTGAIGVAYLLDAIQGGLTPLKSWPIGTGALPSPIGPFANTQLVHIACQVGQISATTQDAVLTVSGAVAAVITGSGVVNEYITATLPAGVVGTLQFTKTLKASPFTKSNISGAVANAVNSLQYKVLLADLPYNFGCDSSNTVSPSNVIAAVAASTGGDPAPATATAITLTGPTSATAGTASGAYTVALSPVGGTVASPVTVTPTAVTGVTFSPASLSLSTASPSGTFTATASTAGTKAIAVTSTGGLTAPAAINLAVAAAGVAATPIIAAPTSIGTPATFTSADSITAQQWTLDGTNVGGATASSYTQLIGDSAKALRVRATSANGTATSLPVLPGVRNMKLSNTSVLRDILATNDGLFLASGDSWLAGFGAAGNAGNSEANLKASSVTSRMAAGLATAGFSVSKDSYFGSGRFANNTPALFMTMDPRWTIGANVQILDQGMFPTFGGGLIGLSTAAANAAEVITFNPGTPFDTVDVYVARTATAGSLDVSVDGGATPITRLVLANGAPGSGDIFKYTVTCPAGSTAFTFKYVQGSGTGGPFIAGIETRVAAAPKIRVLNGARSGTTVQANAAAPTTTANAGAFVPRAVMQKIADGVTKGVLILNGWYNDKALNRTVVQIKADFDTLANEAKARGWEIWYLGYGAMNTATIPAADFNAFEDAVSDHMISAHNAVVFQNAKVFTDFVTANGQGFFFDDIHLGPTGHQKWADSLTSMCKLAATSGALGA